MLPQAILTTNPREQGKNSASMCMGCQIDLHCEPLLVLLSYFYLYWYLYRYLTRSAWLICLHLGFFSELCINSISTLSPRRNL